jgi:hypothetical protein
MYVTEKNNVLKLFYLEIILTSHTVSHHDTKHGVQLKEFCIETK